MCFKKRLIWKIFLNNWGDATLFRREFYVSQYRKASWGNTFVFQALCCMEKNSKKRCLSRFSVQVFSSQSAEGLRREPFFISENLSIEITFAEGGITNLPKILCTTRGGGKSGGYNCLSKNYCLTVPKDFVWETLCVSKFSWYRKKFLRGEDIKIFSQRVACFPVENFMSHSTGIFVGEPFNVSE